MRRASVRAAPPCRGRLATGPVRQRDGAAGRQPCAHAGGGAPAAARALGGAQGAQTAGHMQPRRHWRAARWCRVRRRSDRATARPAARTECRGSGLAPSATPRGAIPALRPRSRQSRNGARPAAASGLAVARRRLGELLQQEDVVPTVARRVLQVLAQFIDDQHDAAGCAFRRSSQQLGRGGVALAWRACFAGSGRQSAYPHAACAPLRLLPGRPRGSPASASRIAGDNGLRAACTNTGCSVASSQADGFHAVPPPPDAPAAAR